MGFHRIYDNYVSVCIYGEGEDRRRLAVPIDFSAQKDELEAVDTALGQLRIWVKKAIKDRNEVAAK